MDFDIYSKIRAHCRPDLTAYLDTPEQQAGAKAVSVKLHGRAGEIAWESETARRIIEAYGDYTARERAAAVLLHHVSNQYLSSVDGNLTPLENSQPWEYARQTREALADYARHFPPTHEAAAPMAALVAAYDDAVTAPDRALPTSQDPNVTAQGMEQNKVELSLDDVLRISDAAKMMGCTVESLLRKAASDDRLLYVALSPHSATLHAVPSHANPRNGRYTTKSHKIVVMQQNYAESIAIAGSADVTQYQASLGGVLDWHYWMLDAPQTVSVDKVFVPRSQLTIEQASETGTSEPVGAPANGNTQVDAGAKPSAEPFLKKGKTAVRLLQNGLNGKLRTR